MYRRRLMDEKKSHNLPKEYQEVSYICSTGTQYINTNIDVRTVNNIYVKFSYTTLSIDTVIIGATTGTYFLKLGTIKSWSNYAVTYYPKENGLYTNEKIIGKKQFIKLDITGRTIETNYMSGELTNFEKFPEKSIIILFGTSQGAKIYPSAVIIYICSINEKVFIPCYRKSDNKTGMYDITNGVFYANAGTGEFIVGPNVY